MLFKLLNNILRVYTSNLRVAATSEKRHKIILPMGAALGGLPVYVIVYYIKLGTITITQCKAMDLSSFDVSVVPGRKVCSRCYSQLSDMLKEPREYKLSKSIHSPKTTIRVPGYTDYNLSDTDIY